MSGKSKHVSLISVSEQLCYTVASWKHPLSALKSNQLRRRRYELWKYNDRFAYIRGAIIGGHEGVCLGCKLEWLSILRKIDDNALAIFVTSQSRAESL